MTEPVGIVVIGTRGFPDVQGGIERHCEELYPRLVTLGCRVRVYARSPYVPRRRQYRGVDVWPLWVPRSKSMEAMFHTWYALLHASLHRSGHHILHIHGIGPAITTAVARLLGWRVVVTTQGRDYSRSKWGRFAKFVLRRGEYTGMAYANAVIAVSRTIQTELQEQYGRTSEYIPNGISPLPHVAAGTQLGILGLEPGSYFLSVGRLVPEKGFDFLVESFASMPGECRLVIAGGADHEDRYSAALRAKGAACERVLFAGQLSREALGELYGSAAALLQASTHEGLPLAVLEAKGFGLPLILSDIPAHHELADAHTLFFKPGDRAGLHSALNGFLDRTGPPPGAQSSKLDAAAFDWERIARQTLAVYKALISPGTIAS